MNKILPTKRNSTIFLATILIAGTITLMPSSFMKEAQAQQEYYYEEMNGYDERPSYYGNDNYEPREYPTYQPDYKPQYSSYEKDNNYKSKKDNGDSISLNINKLKCINNNVNINGNNTGDINVGNSGRSASSPGTDEGYLGVGSLGGNGEGYDNGYNKQKDKGFSCIINNNNNNTIVTVNATDDGDNVSEPTATLAVTKTIRCDPIGDSEVLLQACNTIETTISPDDFNIVVTGNEPDPAEFPGSNTPPGVVVTLGAGDYQVTEELPDLPTLPAGVIVSRTTTFVGDCDDVDPSDPLSIVAAGTIEAGDPQTCDINNLYEARAAALTSSNINTETSVFDINTAGDIASSFSSPPTIAQETTEDDLTAMEKTTKLKQQWLDLLP